MIRLLKKRVFKNYFLLFFTFTVDNSISDKEVVYVVSLLISKWSYFVKRDGWIAFEQKKINLTRKKKLTNVLRSQIFYRHVELESFVISRFWFLVFLIFIAVRFLIRKRLTENFIGELYIIDRSLKFQKFLISSTKTKFILLHIFQAC